MEMVEEYGGKTIIEGDKTGRKEKKYHIHRNVEQEPERREGPDLNVEYPYLDHR